MAIPFVSPTLRSETSSTSCPSTAAAGATTTTTTTIPTITTTADQCLTITITDQCLTTTTILSDQCLTSTKTTDQCRCHNTSSGSEDSSGGATGSSNSNSFHSAASCGGRARCCVVPSSLPSSLSCSSSASPSTSDNCLSGAEESEASPKSDSSPVITIGCTLCQQNRQDRASSEETLKRGDSRRLTIPRGSASSSQPSSSARSSDTIHRQAAVVQHQFVEVDKFNTVVGLTAKSCSCEECVLACRREQLQQLQQQQQQHEQLAGPSGTSGAGVGRSSAVAGQLSIALANAQLASGPTTSSSGGTSVAGTQQHQQQQQQQFMYCNGPPPTATQTIEEQIKQIDRISKECDNSRKSLELTNRRLDDLNDEVRRYREFLGHEKTRRDPTLYKTNTAEPLSPFNDNICRLIDSLTTQLTMEWTEKLRSIQNQTIAKSADKG